MNRRDFITTLVGLLATPKVLIGDVISFTERHQTGPDYTITWQDIDFRTSRRYRLVWLDDRLERNIFDFTIQTFGSGKNAHRNILASTLSEAFRVDEKRAAELAARAIAS